MCSNTTAWYALVLYFKICILHHQARANRITHNSQAILNEAFILLAFNRPRGQFKKHKACLLGNASASRMFQYALVG